jgi:orotidine-5'-phosphate decarboxylase
MDTRRIIVALDFEEREAALALVRQLDCSQCRVKIGKELFTRFGPDLVRTIQEMGFEVFLDLKFHDIPNTVHKAVSAAAELGVWMLTLHASGGEAMLRAARAALEQAEHKPLLVAVTVLTSMSEADLVMQGIQRNTQEQVLRLAALAQECGMDGVVCSALEVSALRSLLRDDFVLVTPGIRPAGDAADDQLRIMTPRQAILGGSTYLVVGRPITRARDPLLKLRAIQSEITGES